MDGNVIAPLVGGQLAAAKSFVGPDPNTLLEKDKVNMSPETFKSTFDTDYKKEAPLSAAMHAYRHRLQPQNQMGYILGSEYARPGYNKLKSGLSSFFSKGPVDSAVLGGLGGAGLGLIGSLGWNAFSQRDVNPRMVTLLSGLLGAGLGGAGGYVNRKAQLPATPINNVPTRIKPEDYDAQIQQIMGKTAGWREPGGPSFRDERNMIMQILQSAPGMSFNEKAHLMQGINQLSVQDAARLANMLGTVGGAAAGAMISRFLIGKGLVSTLLGAVTGGVIGSVLFGNNNSQQTTYGGQPLGRFL